MLNSLRTRLTIIFIVLAIGPLVLIGAVLAQRAFAFERDQALALQSQVAQNASSEVVAYFQGVVGNLNEVGDEIRGLGQPDRSQLLSTLLSALSSGPYQNVYEELTLVDSGGNEQVRVSHQEIIPVSELHNRQGTPEFEKPKATRQAYFSPVWFDQTTGNPFITISVPLYEPRSVQLRGVLIANIRFAAVGDLIAQVPVGGHETLFVTDPKGQLVAHQDHSFAIQNARIALPPQADIQTGLNGKAVALGFSKIQLGDQPLVVVAEEPESQALSLAFVLINTLIVATIIALVVSGGAGLLAVRQIVSPIENLAETTQQIASGDLSQSATVKRKDEIGLLAQSFNSMTEQLRATINSLEQRVKERTQGLEQQTLRLRAAAEVARDAAAAPDVDELLNRAARSIRDRFNLYHTGIFLIDEKKEYAVLYASPTKAGHQMLANHHRLRVGAEGIVGRVAATGEPRIALDTGADPTYFSNPYLPDTHSEMGLPLKSNERMIGVLDIQSDQPEAFTQDDIAIMQVMADQLATAIDRIRLLHQVQSNLAELERTYGSVTEQSWKVFERAANQASGYRYDNIRLEPIREIPREALNTLEQNASASDTFDSSTEEAVAIPIRLRGQVIGLIQTRFQYKDEAKATILMIEQIADRLATALENARLLEDSLNRANKERAIGEITSKISASINMRNVLQTAVEELGRAIPGSDVVIQLVGDSQSNSEEN